MVEGTSPVLVTDSTFSDITTCVGDTTNSTMCLPVIAATDFTVGDLHTSAKQAYQPHDLQAQSPAQVLWQMISLAAAKH